VRQDVIHLAPLAKIVTESVRLDPEALPIGFLRRFHQVLDLDHRITPFDGSPERSLGHAWTFPAKNQFVPTN
jgi:hypothetical protein